MTGPVDVQAERLRELREQAQKRSRGPLPIAEWGPICAGCGTDEYRINGYCSVECRDYHDEELAQPFLDALALLAGQAEQIERLASQRVGEETQQ